MVERESGESECERGERDNLWRAGRVRALEASRDDLQRLSRTAEHGKDKPPAPSALTGLVFRVSGLGFGVWGLGFGV